LTPPPEGRPPGEGEPRDGVPELDPQFAEALREAAAGRPAEPPPPEPHEGPEQAEPEPPPAPAGNPLPDTAEYRVEEAPRDDGPPGPKAPGVAPVIPEPGGNGPPPPRPRLWLKFLLASFLVISAFAAATATAGILEVANIIDDIQPIEGIESQLDEVEGGPMTFLILGSDRRAATAGDDRGLSDTTILLRIDPDRNIIAMLNIPRDLKVHIPGVGTDKFNAAYAYGGPKLTLRTIKRLTAGMNLPINHLVNVDFLGFAQAINAIDCVYIDVDRRYFHSNEGLPAELQYDEIDLQPGYQRLCGEDALDYARYRHSDTDLVRAARQQDFLREARQRVPAARLFTDRKELIDIFTTHTQSDIQGIDTMIEVLNSLIDARNAPIREIRFPARLGPSYVYASRPAIRDAINQFLGFELQSGPRGSLDEANGGGDDGAAGGAARREGSSGGGSGPARGEGAPPRSDGLVDSDEFGREMGRSVARRVSAKLPVFYPRRLPGETIYDQVPRVYHLNDTDGDTHGAYKIVLRVNLPDGTHYFGVQGVRDWGDPPILTNPSETREMGGRDYDIFVTGDRIRLIGWREDGNSYWLSNSLLRTLTNDQMLGIARSMGKLEPKPKPGRKRRRGGRGG
jgi:LCP family protein required for cell wall assembly